MKTTLIILALFGVAPSFAADLIYLPPLMTVEGVGRCTPEMCQFVTECPMSEADMKLAAPFIKGGQKIISFIQLENKSCILTLAK